MHGHEFDSTQVFDGRGIVAWCTCGVGSLMSATIEEAKLSLQPHLDDPMTVRWIDPKPHGDDTAAAA